jgi:hypothetical protein
MIIRTGLSPIISSIGKNNYTPSKKIQVGRVYGVVTTENTPTKAMFEKAGGFSGIGTIFYLDYDQSKEVIGENNDAFFDSCKIAKPLNPQYQYYPILGELVYLEDLPSAASQITSTSSQKYYISIINLWNNNQQNSQPANDNASLGLTFVENPNIRTLLPFEGDHILQGRQGNAIRFSSTTKLFNNLNEWSSVGNDDSPITVLTNGFNYNPSERYHVEQINKDASSIYLTSTQQLPLQTDKTGPLNPITNPILPSKYFNPQIIFNSDRIVINSKKEDVLIFAKNNIELNTKNIINLNADERVHVNSNTVFLGTVDNKLPTEPLLLGNKTYSLLSALLESLYNLGVTLSTTVGSPEGAPALDINSAADAMLNDLEKISNNLEGILSQQNFTA